MILNDHKIAQLNLLKDSSFREFNQIKTKPSMKRLVEFQSKNKYLFMFYHQILQKELGKIVANHSSFVLDDVVKNFEMILIELFEVIPKNVSHINVCEHIYGYFSSEITEEEKMIYQYLLRKLKNGSTYIPPLATLLLSWSEKYYQDYIQIQTYLHYFKL